MLAWFIALYLTKIESRAVTFEKIEMTCGKSLLGMKCIGDWRVMEGSLFNAAKP